MKALGNFRGTIVDAGVTITSGGFPQFVAKLHADEMYDEEAKQWFAWDEFEWAADEVAQRTITSFNVIFGKKGCTLSGDQVKKITGWDGDSFGTLNAMAFEGMQIQWRNEEDTYDGKTKVQVSWIDTFEAEPGGTVRKLDDKGIKDLDAKFAEFLNNAAKPEKAAGTRKRGVKTEAPKTEEPKTEAPKTEEPKTEKPKRAGRPKKAAKTEAPKTEAPAAPEPPAEKEQIETGGPCTKEEAWADVNELKSTSVTDADLAAKWLEQIEAVAPGKEQKELSNEEWGTVRAAVLEATATF
jgi:predicted outer membrane lipoprotein